MIDSIPFRLPSSGGMVERKNVYRVTPIFMGSLLVFIGHSRVLVDTAISLRFNGTQVDRIQPVSSRKKDAIVGVSIVRRLFRCFHGFAGTPVEIVQLMKRRAERQREEERERERETKRSRR